ncbi:MULTISPECIES: BspA family leucine-rich repeat surface protein, partial [unclassified Enterococcus]|uniref:BspA family leucine-rich repeat surface protein n=1 Tax=unclassified Enterococcus TaxID=2608891 RepID=UPI0013EA70A9
MNDMFKKCSSLQSLDLSSFDTSQVTNMSSMFDGCTNLQSITMDDSFDTSRVTNMYTMFFGCSSLKSLDVSSFNTNQVTTMEKMFSGCSSLQSLDLSSFDTSQVTSMFYMFNGCSSLQSLDLGSFDTSQVTTMLYMFNGCSSLNELTLGEKSIFNDTVNLLDGSWSGKHTSVMYATSADFMNNYDGSQPDTFVRKEANYWGTAPYVFDETTGTLTVYAGTLEGNKGTPWGKGEVSADQIQKIEFVESLKAPEDSTLLFANLPNLIEFAGLEKLDTSNVTSMHKMFARCSSLQSLDLSSFHTSNVTRMDNVFEYCSSLKSLDLSHFDTVNVTSMGLMFGYCSSLQHLDLSSFSTSNAPNMFAMFNGSDNLRSIKLGSNFKFSGMEQFDSYFTHKWVGMNSHVRYNSGADFTSQYDGTQPDTYVWDISSQLGVTLESNDPMTVGREDRLVWKIGHSTASAQGRTAKSINGKLFTTETVDFEPELLVEEQDALGNYVATLTIPVTDEGTTNGEHTYSYALPDLAYGNQYKITWKGTPWNNTTVSTAPTFRYELDYDANLELINGDMFLPDSRSTTTNRVIENGGLSFKDVPQELRFNATKLSTDLNEQLIAREDKDWEIGITDFRGTKAKSVTDSDVARQDWDLVATVAPFKDSSNQEIGLETLGITYVD